MVSTGGGGKLASATGTSGNVPIAPPSAPSGGSSGGGNQPPYSPNVVNQTVSFGGHTWRGNPGQGWTDLGSDEERRYQQELATWQAAQAAQAALPPPSTAPPAAPVPQSTVAAKPIGSTATPGSTGTGGGVSGQAFPATSQLGLGTKGLQLAGLAPQAVSAQMKNPLLPTAHPELNPAVLASSLLFAPGALEGLAGLGARGALAPLTGRLAPNLLKEGVEVGAEELAKGGIGQLGQIASQGIDFGKKLLTGIGTAGAGLLGLPNLTSKTPLGPTQGEAKYNPQTRQLTTPTNQPTTMATPANLGANITEPTQVAQAISVAIKDPSKAQDVISGIASPQALQTISTMFNQAQQSGDTQTAQQLANLHSGVQQQLQFIDQITQIISAISGGFGTPNAPGVTEARTPMVQAGIGGALTSPSMAQATGGAPGQNVQMWTPQLPTAPTERNKPAIFPYMGA